MPDPYQLDLTAAQINEAVNNAFDSDRLPAANQTTLCNGDKIAASIDSKVGALATQVTALAARVTDLEGGEISISTATFTKDSITATSDTLVSGYTKTETGEAGIASESSGTITLSGSGGVFLVLFSGSWFEKNNVTNHYFVVNHRVNGDAKHSIPINELLDYGSSAMSVSSSWICTGGDTVDILLDEVSASAIYGDKITINIVKLS